MAKKHNRSLFKAKAKGSYRIENKTEKEATIRIYEEIGWFGVEAADFVKDLDEIKAEILHIRLNTPGGDVFDGTAIANAIKQHKSKTIVHIDGLAASIGSIIAIAGDELLMAENSFFMFHEAWSMTVGNAETMREAAGLLDKIDGVLAASYVKKTGEKEADIKEMMAAETWLTAKEALDMGMIDGIEEDTDEENAKATIFDLSVFANVPDELKNIKKEFTIRDAEKALCDAGCSRDRSKTILAKGFKGDPNQRDAEEEACLQAEREAQIEEEARLREAEKAKIKKGSTEDLLMQAEIMAPTK